MLLGGPRGDGEGKREKGRPWETWRPVSEMSLSIVELGKFLSMYFLFT